MIQVCKNSCNDAYLLLSSSYCYHIKWRNYSLIEEAYDMMWKEQIRLRLQSLIVIRLLGKSFDLFEPCFINSKQEISIPTLQGSLRELEIRDAKC